MTSGRRSRLPRRTRAGIRHGYTAAALLLPLLTGGCADYCPPDSKDFFCRYVVSIRPPDAIRQDLSDRPEALRTDPRYPN